jgi:hypothetical protein
VNPADSLPLRDIHLPEAVSWWPPAIGWWILLILGLLLIVALAIGIRKLLQPKMNKSAKAEIGYVLHAYNEHKNDLLLLQQLSSALRRIGISYLTREEYAGLVGQAWYQHINELVPEKPFSEPVISLLINAPYQKQPEIDAQLLQQVINQARDWVKALPANPSDNINLKVRNV